MCCWAGFDSQHLYFGMGMEVMNMHTHMSPDPTILKYVMGVYKSNGELKGALTVRAYLEAVSFEREMNAWMDELDEKEGIEE
jgi:hypothetical protein